MRGPMELMILVAWVVCGVLLVASCAGGDTVTGPDLSPEAEKILSELSEDARRGFLDTRQQQKEVLQSASSALAEPDTLDTGAVKQLLIRLNRALMRGRTQVFALRKEDVDTTILMRELRRGNNQINEVFARMQKRVPDLTPEDMKDMGS
ncbi:MAG: hypothetical protein ACE5HD_10955 [Acidobacteriota bacterium]